MIQRTQSTQVGFVQEAPPAGFSVPSHSAFCHWPCRALYLILFLPDWGAIPRGFVNPWLCAEVIPAVYGDGGTISVPGVKQDCSRARLSPALGFYSVFCWGAEWHSGGNPVIPSGRLEGQWMLEIKPGLTVCKANA